MPHQDLVILFPIWACMALMTLSIPHLCLTLTMDLSSHSGTQTKLVTGSLWASPLPGDSGHPFDFSWAWRIWTLAGPHLDVVTGRHLGLPWTWRILLLIAPHLDLVTVFPPGPHMDLVALVPILGSPGPGSCGIHLDSTGKQ